MAFYNNSTTDAKSAIPHSVSLNPHSCVGRMKEPAYLAKFKQSTRTVSEFQRYPGQDTDSKSLLNSVAASVAVRRNAMELKFLESALDALRLKEKKALRNLENEMKKYRMELDRIPRTLTSRIAQNVGGLAPPVASDEVLLKRIGKNKKLRVSISHPAKGEKGDEQRKEHCQPESVAEHEENDKTEKPGNVFVSEEQDIKESKETTIPTMDKKPERDFPSKDAEPNEERKEAQLRPDLPEPVGSGTKLSFRRPPSSYRVIQSPKNLALTDSIARTCSEYFNLLKIINEHHQAAASNSTTLPPVGALEHERSLAVIEPSRCQSPRTMRMKEAGTQFDKRYVIVHDDVVVDKEMWPSWWTPNTKPVQTDGLDNRQSGVPVATQSWPPLDSTRQAAHAIGGNECESVSGVDGFHGRQRHQDQRTRRMERIYTKVRSRGITTAKAKPKQSARTKSRPKTKQRINTEPSDSSSASQSPVPTRRSQRGVFLTQSSSESSTSPEVPEFHTEKGGRNGLENVSKQGVSRSYKWRKALKKQAAVRESIDEQCSQCPNPAMHYQAAPKNDEHCRQHSLHNFNIKAQFQCNGGSCHGHCRSCPAQQHIVPALQSGGRLRQFTPIVTPTETVKATTRNSTSGFSSCEPEERRRNIEVASPRDDSPKVAVPESLKLKRDPSIRKGSLSSSGSHKSARRSVDMNSRGSGIPNNASDISSARDVGKEEGKEGEQEGTEQPCAEEALPTINTCNTATGRIETTDSRTQTSRCNSINYDSLAKASRNENYNSFAKGKVKPMSARVVPTFQSQLDNPVFRIELCAISEDQESYAEQTVGNNDDAGNKSNVFRFRNPTRNGRSPKKYQVVLNDLTHGPADDEQSETQPLPPQIKQKPPQKDTRRAPEPLLNPPFHPHAPLKQPESQPHAVHRWKSDMVADNVFCREPLPSSAWCGATQRRKFIPAQCIEPTTAATHTPNVQRFDAPGTGKSTVPPSTAMLRGEECSDFLQSNTCLSGDFATRWRHGAKSQGMSGYASAAGRRSILKPVYESGCESSRADEGRYYHGAENAFEPARNDDYDNRYARPMTAAHFPKRRTAFLSPDSGHREMFGIPCESVSCEDYPPKHTFRFDGPQSRQTNPGDFAEKEPTFADAQYRISRNSNPTKSARVVASEPWPKESVKQPSLTKHETEKDDLKTSDNSTGKEKIWKIKSPRRKQVWKRKRVDSSSSFRNLYNMHEYSLTADQRDLGLGLTSCSSCVIERPGSDSVTSSGELRLKQAMVLERNAQLELQAKMQDFQSRLSTSKHSDPGSEMREISTRGKSVGRKRRKQ